MTENAIDSRALARLGARVLGIAVGTGVITGAATVAFLTIDHLGVKFLWEELPAMVGGVPPAAVAVAVVAIMTSIAALMAWLSGKRPFDTGAAEAEFDHEGRMDYRMLPAGVVFSLASLFSGAAVGPEAPLTDINGGIGTWIAERFGLEGKQLRVITYAGVAGAFGAFFGAAPVGALLAAELISPRSTELSRLQLAAGLASGATGYVTYLALGGHTIAPMLVFPSFAEPRLTDMAIAIVVGMVGAVIGLLYGKVFVAMRARFVGLRSKPWLAALAGGAVTAVAALVSPFLLFSGQSEVPQLISDAASLGILVLLGLGVAKLALSMWSLSTAYFGGPLFPLVFAGTAFGLALHEFVPAVPQGVAVMALVAGMAVSATTAPLSVTLFLSIIAQPSLAPVIALAAVAAYLVRQAVAPTLPGVYRAARAEEQRVAQAAATEAEPA